MTAKQESQISDDEMKILTGPSLVCQVDCINKMNDGTQMTGFIATFNYHDNSTSTANAVGPWGQGGGSSVYGQNKCVKWIGIQIGARRPGGDVEIVTGSSRRAPDGRCSTRVGFGLVVDPYINSTGGTTANRPMLVKEID